MVSNRRFCLFCMLDVYGFYKHEFLMELPNGLGCGSAVLQLIVYFVYRQKFKNKIAADPNQETAKIISVE